MQPSCPEGVELCDGFETGDFSRWDEEETTPLATVSMSAIAANGMHALHAVAPPGDTSGRALLIHRFPSRRALAVRALVRATTALSRFSGPISCAARATRST